MTDAPDEKTESDEPLRPDGWAAWGKKDSEPLKPRPGERTAAPKSDEKTGD